MNKTVLVSGGSIAGPTLAYWLKKFGFEPTIVEKAATIRAGGNGIDVRGHAAEIARRMGIHPAIEQARTNIRGVRFVDESGKTRGSFETAIFETAGNVELLRGDLCQILHQATKDNVEYIFDDSITELEQDADGVDVSFERSKPRRFDLVVGADGLHSIVRRMAFGDESDFLRHVGYYVAGFPVDPSLGSDGWAEGLSTPGRSAGTYTSWGKASAFFFFERPADPPIDYRDTVAQKRVIAELFEGQGWKVPELLAELARTDDLYFDSMSQVRMPTWSTGRVTLVGDAAYCPTLLSGGGSTLAMIGAYFLAGELAAAGGDHTIAFERYEERFRPVVRKAQQGVRISGGLLIPSTQFAIWRRNQFSKLMGVAGAAGWLQRKFGLSRNPTPLPEFTRA